MSFANRTQAGSLLAEQLLTYENHLHCMIVGLPRGGVVTAAAVARRLQLPLDIVCPRKIGAPGNPEFAIGAITESGEGFFDREILDRYQISTDYLEHAIA